MAQQAPTRPKPAGAPRRRHRTGHHHASDHRELEQCPHRGGAAFSRRRSGAPPLRQPDHCRTRRALGLRLPVQIVKQVDRPHLGQTNALPIEEPQKVQHVIRIRARRVARAKFLPFRCARNRFTIATSSRCPATSPAIRKTSPSPATRSPIGTSKPKATDLQFQHPQASLVGPHLRRACRPDEGRLTDNVLPALPKSAHSGAKAALAEIYNAEDRDHALESVKAFEADYGAKWPKAVAKITEHVDVLLAFYDYPAEHWVYLRTTNPIVILSRSSIHLPELGFRVVDGVVDVLTDV